MLKDPQQENRSFVFINSLHELVFRGTIRQHHEASFPLTCRRSPQVGLWKSHSQHKLEEGCFVANQKQIPANSTSNGSSLLKSNQSDLKELQNIIDEIELLRSSRDQQVDEIMLCNQRLEQELWSSKEAVAALEDSNQALKSEQVGMRRKVEEARHVLLTSMNKVKELETKANHVPVLERRILQLESELLFLRSVHSAESTAIQLSNPAAT